MRQKWHAEREENRAKLSGGPRHFICQTTQQPMIKARAMTCGLTGVLLVLGALWPREARRLPGFPGEATLGFDARRPTS